MNPWTDAPWIVRELGNDCFVEGNEFVGSTVAGKYKREILGDETYEKKKADARLIAAAPELVDEIWKLRGMLLEVLARGGDAPGAREATESARALLARIKGEA